MQITDLDTTTDPEAALQQVLHYTLAQPSTFNSLEGYVVEGTSGARYFVDKSSLRTYDVCSGRFICLVQSGKMDFDNATPAELAARLLTLSNDIPSQLWPDEE